MSKIFWIIVFMVLFVKLIESPIGIVLSIAMVGLVVLKLIHSIVKKRKRKHRYDEPY